MVENRESTDINNIPFDDLRKIVKSGRRVPKEIRWGSTSEGWDEFFNNEQQRAENKSGRPLGDLDLYVRTYFALRRGGVQTVEGLIEILKRGKVPSGIGPDGLKDIQSKL